MKAHFALRGQSALSSNMLVGAGPSLGTANLQVVFNLKIQRRGQPVGALATSSGGGATVADLLAKAPVQVLRALRPCVNAGALR